MAFKKGEGGRPKGVQNKFSGELKDMILKALEESGGVAYLTKQAQENPHAFLSLVGKTLPLKMGADGSGLAKLVIEWQAPSS